MNTINHNCKVRGSGELIHTTRWGNNCWPWHQTVHGENKWAGKELLKMHYYHFHIVKTESDELPLKLKWDVVESHDRHLHLPGMTVRKVFHKAFLEITISLPKAWHMTCLHRNTYFMVLKVHLCTCKHFFKHMVTKMCQPHCWHHTHNHFQRVSLKMFFPFTPHLLPFLLTVYNPAWQGTLLQVPLSSDPSLSCERDSIVHKQDALNTAPWFFSTSHKELDIWVD